MTTTLSFFSSVSRLATGALSTGTLTDAFPSTDSRTRRVVARVTAAALLAAGAMGAICAAPVEADDEGAEITASISGLRNDEGVVRIALYAREDQWLSHEHTVATCTAHVHGDSASCSLGHHAPGTYAIALLHDEDADGDMDTDFFGFPQEGYGFSSGARPGLGAPSFGDASFAHGLDRTVAAIRARYGL